jgi:pimeloyl-ACP methyl ester carboxylesterase
VPRVEGVAVRVDVGGYELALTRRGRGVPSVVFVSGLGEPGTVWDRVQARMTEETTRVTYDRAGVGESDLLPESQRESAQPAGWLVDQLRHLLGAADVPTPYVLVGHSVGGAVVDLYAAYHGDDIAGLVLVDASDWSFTIGMDEATTIDGAEPGGLPIDWMASQEEFESRQPKTGIPVAVIGCAPWRWLRPELADKYRPLTLTEVDQRWQRHQLALTERWHGHLVLPHNAGHRAHEEAPELVSLVVDAVIQAARRDRPLDIDQAALNAAGGSFRVSSTAGLGLRAWTPAMQVR